MPSILRPVRTAVLVCIVALAGSQTDVQAQAPLGSDWDEYVARIPRQLLP